MRYRAPFFAFLAAVLLTLASCGGAVPATPTPPVSSSPFPASVTDFQGNTLAIPARPERGVSIGPSITAFLFALGAGPRVRGCDGFRAEPGRDARRERAG